MNRADVLTTAAQAVTVDRAATHGGFAPKWRNPSGTRCYYAWRSMRSRCVNERNEAFANYGGRGISVCPKWINNYDAFFDDMGEPIEGESLERLDVNGNYEPDNCVWASMDAQSNNKRTSVLIEHDGKSMTVAQWAAHLGIVHSTLHRRLQVYGMTPDKALTSGSLRPKWRHGTRQGYETGCRCIECKSAHAKRQRKMRLRRKARAAE